MDKNELYPIYKNDPKGLVAHLEQAGYKMLGWQVHAGNCSELKTCYEAGHMGHQGPELRQVSDIQHTRSGSDVTYWCNGCKHYWKIDMSD